MTPSHPTGPAVPAAASAEEALRFAEALAHSCARALRETVAGVILHGSLTLADYLPGRSDVDLLVVVDDPLTDAQVAALTEAVVAHRRQGPGRVDLRVVTRQVAASPTPAPPMEAYIELTPGSGSGLHVERGHPGERDLVVEFSMCRAHGRSLLGTAPAALIGEVPAEWALGRDPTLRVVRDALHRRRGDPTRSIDPAQVAQLLAVVRGRLAEPRDGS